MPNKLCWNKSQLMHLQGIKGINCLFLCIHLAYLKSSNSAKQWLNFYPKNKFFFSLLPLFNKSLIWIIRLLLRMLNLLVTLEVILNTNICMYKKISKKKDIEIKVTLLLPPPPFVPSVSTNRIEFCKIQLCVIFKAE